MKRKCEMKTLIRKKIKTLNTIKKTIIIDYNYIKYYKIFINKLNV